MVIEKECSIDPARLSRWVSNEVGTCTITVTPLPIRKLGSVTLPRSLVRIEGSVEACRETWERFYLAFMSAGG